MPHSRVNAEPLSVIRVFVTSEATVCRLPEQSSKGVLGVLSGPYVGQYRVRHLGQAKLLIQLTVREQTRVACHCCSVKCKLHLPVESDPETVSFLFTHWVRSFLPGKLP